MKCSDVMTKNPVCCVATDNVNVVARLMADENVGSIPVVEHQDNKRLIGIVTDRDLAVKVVGENRTTMGTRIQDVMTSNPVTCHPDDDINSTLDSMSQHQVRRIPVTNMFGQVVGIISQADIALRMDEQKTAEVVEEISKPA